MQQHTITFRGKEINYSNLERRAFWHLLAVNRWEPETFDVIDKYVKPGTNFIDIGSWISPISIYASMLGANVYSIDPDPVAWEEGVINQAVNKCTGITNFNMAISDDDALQVLNSQTIGGMGNSESSLIERKNVGDTLTVETKRLSTFLTEQKLIGADLFIKMDIEGGEALVFPEAHQFLKEHKPTIYFSIHPAFLDEPRVKQIEDVIFDVYNVT